MCFILTTICDCLWTFSIEFSYGAFSVPNFVVEKALISICMRALVILSLEIQWHSGVDAWVGYAYHTDTRLAAAFMSDRLSVVLSLVTARMFLVNCFQGAAEAQP